MSFDTGYKRQDSRDPTDDLNLRASSASAFSMFLDLGAKPMNALDVNFEVLHSQVICMPGELCMGDNIIVIAVGTIFTWFSVCSIFNDLTGTRDTRGAPVIFVDAGKPEWELPDFNSEEIARVCLYFFQIPRYVCIY